NRSPASSGSTAVVAAPPAPPTIAEPAKPGSADTPAPAAPAGNADAADPVAGMVVAAKQLAAAGKLDRALDVVVAGRALYRDRAELPLLAGKLYFSKFWWAEGIASFREAIKLDPSLATDKELCEIAVGGFMTTPDWDGRLSTFVLELGPSALPALDAAAQAHRDPALRARAVELAKRIQTKHG
ncbi:MAG TPA: hypothetical protein VIV58_10800, partial [Kofleriaceae bacterium]